MIKFLENVSLAEAVPRAAKCSLIDEIKHIMLKFGYSGFLVDLSNDRLFRFDFETPRKLLDKLLSQDIPILQCGASAKFYPMSSATNIAAGKSRYYVPSLVPRRRQLIIFMSQGWFIYRKPLCVTMIPRIRKS